MSQGLLKVSNSALGLDKSASPARLELDIPNRFFGFEYKNSLL